MILFNFSIALACLVMAVHAEGGNTATPSGSGASPGINIYNILQMDYAHFTLIAMAGVVVLYFVWRTVRLMSSHLRRLHGLNNEAQRYFVRDDPRMAWLKKNVIDAPLFRYRHHREFQLSRAVSMGCLPSRFQAICLTGLIAMNVTLCILHIPFSEGDQKFGSILRNRTGTLATANLIPLVILAGRNNPLIPLLGLSFDSWDFYHRWIARIVVLESIAHTLSWMIPKVEVGGWKAVGAVFPGNALMMTGLLSVCGFCALALTTFSAFRHAFYETFLHLHLALVLLALIALWYHLEGLPEQRYLLVALVCWGLERFVRLALNIYRNFLGGQTTATVEVLPGEAMRVTLKLARPWVFRPGQHTYLHIPSVGLWTSHPFSVAWNEPGEIVTDEKGIVMTQQDVMALQKETVSLLIRRRTGFTDSLYKRAEKAAGGQLTLSAIVEGPYGGIQDLDSYGTVVLFAGGVGITHHVPYVRHLVQGFADGLVAARRVTLVWTIQSPEHLEWIRPWMTNILRMDRRREVLRIMLFITRPRNTKEIHSPSTTVQMFPGRPNINALLDMEIENQIGAMGVVVCGTGSLGDDVRYACRQRQSIGNIDFIEESFSW